MLPQGYGSRFDVPYHQTTKISTCNSLNGGWQGSSWNCGCHFLETQTWEPMKATRCSKNWKLKSWIPNDRLGVERLNAQKEHTSCWIEIALSCEKFTWTPSSYELILRSRKQKIKPGVKVSLSWKKADSVVWLDSLVPCFMLIKNPNFKFGVSK